MTDSAIRLIDEILRLSEDDREELACVLWDSLDGEDLAARYPDEAAWIAELKRRSASADAGQSKEQPYREAIAELRAERL